MVEKCFSHSFPLFNVYIHIFTQAHRSLSCFILFKFFCRQSFVPSKRESKVKQRENTSHGEPMSRALWWLPDLQIPQHGQTHAHRQFIQTHTHTETNTRSIFIVFGSAAVYVLPSLSAPHTLHSKSKNLYYWPASVTTIILLKQPLKTNYICTVFSSDCSGWAMLTGLVGFPFNPQTPFLQVYCLLHGAANDWSQSTWLCSVG